MRVGFVLVGAICVALATGLEVIAHHDGVLGVTPPSSFPSPGQQAEPVRTRLIIDGTASRAAPHLEGLNLGAATDGAEAGHTYVTAHFDRPDSSTVVLLRLGSMTPAVGEVVIVEGTARTFVPPAGSGAPILVLEAETLAEPLLFKNG